MSKLIKEINKYFAKHGVTDPSKLDHDTKMGLLYGLQQERILNLLKSVKNKGGHNGLA